LQWHALAWFQLCQSLVALDYQTQGFVVAEFIPCWERARASFEILDLLVLVNVARRKHGSRISEMLGRFGIPQPGERDVAAFAKSISRAHGELVGTRLCSASTSASSASALASSPALRALCASAFSAMICRLSPG
jgi:hypothetical protein